MESVALVWRFFVRYIYTWSYNATLTRGQIAVRTKTNLMSHKPDLILQRRQNNVGHRLTVHTKLWVINLHKKFGSKQSSHHYFVAFCTTNRKLAMIQSYIYFGFWCTVMSQPACDTLILRHTARYHFYSWNSIRVCISFLLSFEQTNRDLIWDSHRGVS